MKPRPLKTKLEYSLASVQAGGKQHDNSDAYLQNTLFMHIISSEGRTAAGERGREKGEREKEKERENTGKQREENLVDLVIKKENHLKLRCRRICVFVLSQAFRNNLLASLSTYSDNCSIVYKPQYMWIKSYAHTTQDFKTKCNTNKQSSFLKEGNVSLTFHPPLAYLQILLFLFLHRFCVISLNP